MWVSSKSTYVVMTLVTIIKLIRSTTSDNERVECEL
jgi:hypothetical protein